MKTISSFLALMNSLMAGVILAFSFSPTEISQVPAWWLCVRVGADHASAVIAVSILTWLSNKRVVRSGLLTLSSLFLVALGAATAVWTVHLAIVSGDMESYMIVYGGSLILQGVVSLFANQSGSLLTS